MPRPLRLMTWNVRSLRDERDALIRVLRDCAPDVLFVQEAPRFLRAQSKLAALARESGLVVGAGGRPAAGVAVLTTLRIDVDGPANHLLTKSPKLHQRGLAVVQVALGSQRFVAASMHLGLQSGERQRHVAEIAEILSARQLPAVVAGDLNEGSDGTAWRRLCAGRQDAGRTLDLPTFPAVNPSRRIETVFVPAGWQIEAVSPTEITDESDLLAATDHRPVVVDVMESSDSSNPSGARTEDR